MWSLPICQVSIDQPFVAWSGNCGNLSAAVGPFAIANGLVDPQRVPDDGIAIVRIWQANIGKTIIAPVPLAGGAVQETGDFRSDERRGGKECSRTFRCVCEPD